MVDTGYAEIPFPFAEHRAPPLHIRKTWKLDELLGYISTWSAVRKAHEEKRDDLLSSFAEELAELWGDANEVKQVLWPINMRLATL